jgi:hypothetical protein
MKRPFMKHSGGRRYRSAMKSNLSRRLVLALACAAFLQATNVATARCLTPGQAQKAVASGAVLRLGVIVRAVGGEIVNAQLCETGGPLVYQLAVMRPGGQIETVVVDATSGQRLR